MEEKHIKFQTNQINQNKKKNKQSKPQDTNIEENGSANIYGLNNNFENTFIQDIYLLLFSVGKGSFGRVYLAWNFKEEQECAVKVETSKQINQLKLEFEIIKILLKTEKSNKKKFYINYSGETLIPQERIVGFPKLYGYGTLLTGNNYLIMEGLGPNLMDLFNFSGRHFSLMTVCLIALQILSRIEYFHSHNYIHRDIKPENFVMGLGSNSNIVYLVDYGLAKQFRDPKTRKHIPYREGRLLKGTARYVSINTHLGIDQSRRDDLESIGYMLLFFLRGNLPWQGIKGNHQHNKIFEKKVQIPIEILCLDIPDNILQYFTYVRELNFEDKPDYKYLKGLFSDMLTRMCEDLLLKPEEITFDWMFESPVKLHDFLNKLKSKKQQSNKKESISNKHSNTNTNLNANSNLLSKKNINNNYNSKTHLDSVEENNNLSEYSIEKKYKFHIKANLDTENEYSMEEDNLENLEEDELEDKDDSLEADDTICISRFDNNEEADNDIALILSESRISDQAVEEIDGYINKKLNYLKQVSEKNENYINNNNTAKVVSKKSSKKIQFKYNNTNNTNNTNTTNAVNANLFNSSVVNKNKIKEKTSNKNIVNNINNKNLTSVLSINNEKADLSLDNENNNDDNDDTLLFDIAKPSNNFITQYQLSQLYSENLNQIPNDITEKEFSIDKNIKTDDDIKLLGNENKTDCDEIVPIKNQNKDKLFDEFSNNNFNNNKILSFLLDDKEDKEDKDEMSNNNNAYQKPNNNHISVKNMVENRKKRYLSYKEFRLTKEKLLKIIKKDYLKYYNEIETIHYYSLGMVKKVMNKQTREIRIVKELDKNEHNTRLVDMLKVISHTKIINFYQVFESEDKYFLVLEYIDGISLKEFLDKDSKNRAFDKNSLDAESLIFLFYQVIRIINYINSSVNKVHNFVNFHSFVVVNNNISSDNKNDKVSTYRSNNDKNKGNKGDSNEKNNNSSVIPNYLKYTIKLIDLRFLYNENEVITKDFMNYIMEEYKCFNDKNKFEIGNYLYFLPNELQVDNLFSKLNDVFSCGILLYYILYRQSPKQPSYLNILTNIFSQKSEEENEVKVKQSNQIYYKSKLNKNKHFKQLEKFYLKMTDNFNNRNLLSEYVGDQIFSELNYKNNLILEVNEIISNSNLSNNLISTILNGITEFPKENKLKISILLIISTNFILKMEDEKILSNVFEILEGNNAGVVSKTDFIDNLKQYFNDYCDVSVFENQNDKIFKMIDSDENLFLTYEELKAAFMNNTYFLTEEILKKVFKFLDVDDSGKISPDEIEKMIGGQSAKWNKIVIEYDNNIDGEIDVDEFMFMMKS